MSKKTPSYIRAYVYESQQSAKLKNKNPESIVTTLEKDLSEVETTTN